MSSSAGEHRLNFDLERVVDAGTLSFPTASRYVSPTNASGSHVHTSASVEQVDATTRLIDPNTPSPIPLLPAVVSPTERSYVFDEKQDYANPVRFYAAPGNDNNNNRITNERIAPVARSSTELLAAMLRIDAAGVDCFSCDDRSIRDSHCSGASELMAVNVTKAPVCGKIKHSQHVVSLSPVDDPEDLRDAMEEMMLECTDVNLVSVLFDKTDGQQRLQVLHMLNVLALAYRQSSWLQFLC